MRRIALLLSVMLALAWPAFAVEPDEMLQDPALEARARALSQTLRCMVCQNESIDESNAPLARDLRLLVRERILNGESNDAVRDFLVARYGEFILLEPRFGSRTLLLWITPLIALLAGAIGIGVAMRVGRAAPVPLSDAEKRRLTALVEENKKP